MAIDGIVKIIAVLLSLAYSITAFTDYGYRPTTKPHTRQHMGHVLNRNRYSSYNNETPTHMHTEAWGAENKSKEHDDGRIIYPDVNLKNYCSFGLCENVNDYPKEQIKKLLSRSDFMYGYFNATEEVISIDNRFNSDELSLCETKVHTIYPLKANNTMKEEKVIVNVDGYKQGIVFETCVNNGKCKFSSNFPTGYTSYCKQKYIHKKLMVLGDNDKFVFDSFEVPSCCVCTVTRTD